jgi:DNA-binding IclR family transcriptional regulator
MSLQVNDTPYYFLDLIKRTTEVIELISERGELSVAEIVRLLGYDRNAVNRVVLTLVDLGYLTRLDNKRYIMTMKLFRISSKVITSETMFRLVRRHMKALSEKFDETVNFGQRHDSDVLTVEVICGTKPIRYVSHVGNTAPLHNASTGKCILASLDDKDLADFIGKIKFQKRAKKSITNVKDLWKEIYKIRQQGYAIDDEEWNDGVRCVGIPIYQPTGVCNHSMSIAGMASVFKGAKLKELIDALLEVKLSLMSDMGLGSLKV